MRHRRAARATTLLWAAALTLTQIGGGCRALTFELPSNGVQKCFYEHAKQEVIMEANFRVIGKDYDNVPMVDAEVKTPQGKQVLKEMQKTRGHLDFVPAVDGVHAFCFRQHTRGKKAILSLNIRSGERDSTTTSIAQKGACVPARRQPVRSRLRPAGCIPPNVVAESGAVGCAPRLSVVGTHTSRCYGRAEHLTPLEESILNLARDLESLQIEQRYMRQRERAHRNSTRCRPTLLIPTPALSASSCPLAWHCDHLHRFRCCRGVCCAPSPHPADTAASESTNQRVIQWSFFQAAALVAVSLLQIFYIKKLFETTRTV
jgi:hypothetical protein